MVRECRLGHSIEATVLRIRFELLVPPCRVELAEPRAKFGQLLLRQLAYVALDLLNFAHRYLRGVAAIRMARRRSHSVPASAAARNAVRCMVSLGSIYFDHLCLAGRTRDSFACLVHPHDVKADGFADEPGGMSTISVPDTVMLPGFVGWWNCR
jgi:hypothetical protein